MDGPIDSGNGSPGKRDNASGAGTGIAKPDARKHTGNSTAAQCARGLARLRLGPVNTYELSREEDIYDPPARIFQLRHQYNHHIDLVWTHVTTEANVTHRVGKYVLVSEAAE